MGGRHGRAEKRHERAHASHPAPCRGDVVPSVLGNDRTTDQDKAGPMLASGPPTCCSLFHRFGPVQRFGLPCASRPCSPPTRPSEGPRPTRPRPGVTAFLFCAPRLAVFSRWDGRLRSPSPHIPCRRRFGDRPAGRVRLCLAWKKVGPGLAPSRARGHQDSGATTSRRARVRLNGPAPGRQENTNLSR
jgi:hypothetical protein